MSGLRAPSAQGCGLVRRPDPRAVPDHGRSDHLRRVKASARRRRCGPTTCSSIGPALPVAVVEAKREYAIPGKGLQQAKRYADLLDVPLAYSTNGKGIVEDDRDTGRETDRPRRLPGARRAVGALPGVARDLPTTSPPRAWRFPFNRSLRNFDGSVKEPRYYQRTAINRAVEAILEGDKRLLLTIATGTGKTFVAMQIVWKLWNSGWRRRAAIRASCTSPIATSWSTSPIGRDFVPAFGDGPVWKLRGEAKTRAARSTSPSTRRSPTAATADDGIFREYAARLLRPDHRRRVPPRKRRAPSRRWRRDPRALLAGDAARHDRYAEARRRPQTRTRTSATRSSSTRSRRASRTVSSRPTECGASCSALTRTDGRRTPGPARSLRQARSRPGSTRRSHFERVVSLLSRTEAAARHLTEYLQADGSMGEDDRLLRRPGARRPDAAGAAQRQRRPHATAPGLRRRASSATKVTIGNGHLGNFADTEKRHTGDRDNVEDALDRRRPADGARTSCSSDRSGRWRCSSR